MKNIFGLVFVLINFLAVPAAMAVSGNSLETTSAETVKSFISKIEAANCATVGEVVDALDSKRTLHSLSDAAMFAYDDIADMKAYMEDGIIAYNRGQGWSLYHATFGEAGYADQAFQAKKHLCSLNSPSGIRNGFEK